MDTNHRSGDLLRDYLIIISAQRSATGSSVDFDFYVEYEVLFISVEYEV